MEIGLIIEFSIIIGMVLCVIYLQTIFFRQTRSHIKDLENFFPDENAFEYLAVRFKTVQASSESLIAEEEVSQDLENNWEDEEDNEEDEDIEREEWADPEDENANDYPITCANSRALKENSPHMIEVLLETNRYLQANDGAAADFNLLSDICESKILSIEKKAEANLPLPLFIGLMGTFIGVIMGILFLWLGGFQEKAILSFLGGIFIAMIGSFFGLLFTTLNTHFYFKKAKDITEVRKFNYLNFVRASLLPHLNASMADSFTQLKNTLMHFNNDFKLNVGTFHSSIKQVSEYANSQREFIKEINKIGLKQITESNLKILNDFTKASNEFSKVSGYLVQISSSYDKLSEVLKYSEVIFSKFNGMSNTVDALSDGYKDNIKVIETTMRVLTQNYESLNNVNSVVMQHVQNSDSKIAEFVELEKNKIDFLVQSLNEKLINAFDDHAKNQILDEISKIEDIKTNLADLVKTSNGLNQRIIGLLEIISKKGPGSRGGNGIDDLLLRIEHPNVQEAAKTVLSGNGR